MSKNELQTISVKKMRKIILNDFNKKNVIKNVVICFLVIVSSFLSVALAWVMQKAINSITDDQNMNNLLQIFVIAFICIMSCMAIQYICEHMKNTYIADFSVYIKEKMFEELLKKNIIQYEHYNSGYYNSAFQTDIIKLTASYVLGRWAVLSGISTCIMGIASMLFMSLKLSLLVLMLQIIPVFLTLFLGRKLPEYEKRCAELRGVFGSEIQDYLKGFRLIKTFSSEEIFSKKFMFHNFKLEKSAKKMRNKNITIDIVNNLSTNIMTVLMFFVGGIEVVKGNVQIGTIIACFELFEMISEPLSGITTTINLIRTSDGIFVRIYKLFYCSQPISEENNLDNEKNAVSTVVKIELKNFSFAYDEDKNVLKNINVLFDNNKKYAIVGNSGSGKSTLIKLILGYYTNYSGEILINGNELRDVDLESLSKEVSLVQQDVFIFNDTISANITMGAEFSKEQIDSVIESSGLSDFVCVHGKDYLCGEDGRNLSGGEKQRISIARALLRNSGVIFFDEATSSLDNATTLEKICIAITHKLDLNVLRKYDQILVFSNGEIVERGKLDEIMECKGYFFNLYNSPKSNA